MVPICAFLSKYGIGDCQYNVSLTRIQAWQSEDLLAIQIPGSIADLHHDAKQIVENTNPDYRRDSAAKDGLAIAVVNAKDIAKPEDLDDHSATCWIKMSEVTIEGLRQAFLDPGSRIRNPKEGKLEPEEHAELVALAWEGGFLDGAAIDFNPNLNVLVGGRGTGKSTVIESIRTVLGLEAIIRHVLKNGTKISLLVRAHRPAVREYRIERTIPNPPLVRDDHGEVSNLSPQDVLPRVEVFGQHELELLLEHRLTLRMASLAVGRGTRVFLHPFIHRGTPWILAECDREVIR